MNSLPTLPPVETLAQTSPRERTVLIVDDFAPLCDLVARHLSSSGYHVLTAHDAVEARRIARSSCGQAIDLLLTDVEMPAMGGDELAEWFTTERPQAHVLLMSHRPQASGHCRDAGLLQKPFSLDALGTAVRQALGPTARSAAGGN